MKPNVIERMYNLILNSSLSDKKNENRKSKNKTRETRFLIHYEGGASLLVEARVPLREGD